MKNWRQVVMGVVMALLSSLMILGSAMLSLVENGVEVAQGMTATATLNSMDVMPSLTFFLPGELTLTALAGMITNTPAPTLTPSLPCAPQGWSVIVAQPGDTLASLATKYGVSVAELAQANCMDADINTLSPDSFISVPPSIATLRPTSIHRPTATVCYYPSGWVSYTVRSGDTLSSLGSMLGVSYIDLQRANCMGSSTRIVTGQTLYLPRPLPTRRPPATRTPTTTSIPPTDTFTPEGPTPTPSDTPDITPTSTDAQEPTPVSTDTPLLPTDTSEPTPSEAISTEAAPTEQPPTEPPPTDVPPTNAPPPTAVSVEPSTPSTTQIPN